MEASQSTPKRYQVFLSYRHTDNRDLERGWASWLKNELERYQIPKALIGASNYRGEIIPSTLAPVFRDEDSLGAVADLSQRIAYGLQRSESLVCICSPRSADSQWVRDELRMFKEMGKSHRIQAVVIDGLPFASEGAGADEGSSESEECFPPELKYGVADPKMRNPEGHPLINWEERADPLWADLRPRGTRIQGFTSSGAYRHWLDERGQVPKHEIEIRVADYEDRLRSSIRKVVAGILGVDLDELFSREAEYRARQAEEQAASERRGRQKILAMLSVMTVLAISAGFQWLRTNRLNEKLNSANIAITSSNEKMMAVLLRQTENAIAAGQWHESVGAIRELLNVNSGSPRIARILAGLLVWGGEDRLDLPDRAVKLELPPGARPDDIQMLNVNGRSNIAVFMYSVAGSDDSNTDALVIYDLNKGHVLGKFPNYSSAVVSSDGCRFVICGDDANQPLVFELSGSTLVKLEFPKDAGTYDVVSWAGELVQLSEKKTGACKIWDPFRGRWIKMPNQIGGVKSSTWSDDGSLFAWLDERGKLAIYNRIKGTTAVGDVLGGEISGMQFGADSGSLYIMIKNDNVENVPQKTRLGNCDVVFRVVKWNAVLSADCRYALTSDFPTARIEAFETSEELDSTNDQFLPPSPIGNGGRDTFGWVTGRQEIWVFEGHFLGFYAWPFIQDLLGPATAKADISQGLSFPPIGPEIQRFLKLSVRPEKADNLVELLSLRDELHADLDDPEKFRDFSPKWRKLLHWWTTRPGSRAAEGPELWSGR